MSSGSVITAAGLTTLYVVSFAGGAGDPLLERIGALIATIGFPVAVASYLLIRIEARLEELTKAINELRHLLHGRGQRALPPA